MPRRPPPYDPEADIRRQWIVGTWFTIIALAFVALGALTSGIPAAGAFVFAGYRLKRARDRFGMAMVLRRLGNEFEAREKEGLQDYLDGGDAP